MVDVLTPQQRSFNMSRIKGGNTKPELRLRSLLHSLGLRFRIHNKGLPGKPDIVLPKYRAVVFVHGCFWHRHEGCRYATVPKTRPEFWEEKFERTVRRDMQQTAALKELGWRVFCIWECELKADGERTAAEVAMKIRGEVNGD